MARSKGQYGTTSLRLQVEISIWVPNTDHTLSMPDFEPLIGAGTGTHIVG
jgi:hypothetical protein